MGHLADREVPKLVKRPYSGWGYSYGKYWELMGRSGYEPQTDQSVVREGNIWAFQYSLHKHYNLKIESEFRDVELDPEHQVYELVSPAIYMGAFFIYASRFNPFPLPKDMSLKERDEFALHKLADYVMELEDTKFSFENFVMAWSERMEALKETKDEFLKNSDAA